MEDGELAVSVVQAALSPGGDNNESHLVGLVERAAADGPDVVLLPNHLTRAGPMPLENALVEALADAARDHSAAVVGAMDERAEDGCFNTAFVIGSDGRPLGVQRKFMLSPAESAALRPASEMRVFDAPSARLAVVVGEDLLFPDFCRIAALSGAEVVLCPSLVAGGVVRNLRTACRARAFEGSVFVANANGIPADRSGQRLIVGGSTVAGPYCGRNVLAALGPGEGVATARLDIGRLRADRRAPQGSGPAGRVRRLGLDPNRSVELLGRLGLELDVEIRTVKGSGED